MFGCQHLILDGDSLPENYNVYGKLSVGYMAKSTSVNLEIKKGRVVWNEVLNFPITVSQALMDECQDHVLCAYIIVFIRIYKDVYNK